MSASRLPASFSAGTQSSADDFGLVAWLEQTRLRLPLRGVEVRFHVAGTLARVEIVQIFQNPRDVPLDISYQFPLPAAASVHRCELIADGRTIAAVVEEEEKAREEFARAKAEGRRAALVETRRDNLFQLRLGNIQPREIVAIRLGYVQELERAVRTVALRIPVCPGERYIPGDPLLRSNLGRGAKDDTDQVPDASLISPPRIDALHPDAALFHLCGELPAGTAAVGSVVSPSHLVALHETDGRLRVGFVGDGNVPDRDFILRWELPALAPGTAELLEGRLGGRRHGLLRFVPPAQPETVRPAPRQLWFLVDRSGSMQGAKWERTCEALLNCVAGLRPDDRVAVTLFESGFSHFAEKPLAPDVLLADPRFRAIARLGTAGGTELLPALQAILGLRERHRDPAAVAHLIVITDGQIGNESAVLGALDRHADLAVHTIGIDTAVNDGLLQKLAASHGGRSMLISPHESVSEAVELVLRGSDAPALRHLRLAAGVTTPDALPNGLAGLETSLLLEGDWADGVPLLEGETADGASWSCRPACVSGDAETLRLIGAHRQIQRLQRVFNRAAAIALAKQVNLLCEGASFIAVDRATKVAVATAEFEQPVFVPDDAFSIAKCSWGVGDVDMLTSPSNHLFESAPQATQGPLRKLFGGSRDGWRSPTWPAANPKTFALWRQEPARELDVLRAELVRALTADGILSGDGLPRLLAALLDTWWGEHLAATRALGAIAALAKAGSLGLTTTKLVEAACAGGPNPLSGRHPEIERHWQEVAQENSAYRRLAQAILEKDYGVSLISAYRRFSFEQATLVQSPVAPASARQSLP